MIDKHILHEARPGRGNVGGRRKIASEKLRIKVRTKLKAKKPRLQLGEKQAIQDKSSSTLSVASVNDWISLLNLI